MESYNLITKENPFNDDHDRLDLNVPYEDKDIAKEKGAYWDHSNKTWFITLCTRDWSDFKKWIPENMAI